MYRVGLGDEITLDHVLWDDAEGLPALLAVSTDTVKDWISGGATAPTLAHQQSQ
jgi:hypothetical protein